MKNQDRRFWGHLWYAEQISRPVGSGKVGVGGRCCCNRRGSRWQTQAIKNLLDGLSEQQTSGMGGGKHDNQAACSSYVSGGLIQMLPDEIIITKEKAVLDRWKTGDTFGFIEAAAEEITYFDPGLKKRCTGKKEFRNWISAFSGTFSFPDYELMDPQVQMHGDVGILTFNFVGLMQDGRKELWNTTEVYKLIEGDWKLISSHWSQTKSE